MAKGSAPKDAEPEDFFDVFGTNPYEVECIKFKNPIKNIWRGG